ncbi:hypothetical protein [Flavobacterium sp. N502540]|uniref:hypothetical protein n=1 Tax=Flavobacterium sp. N502540 TaxID=2986838 RepID=UPI0022241447|nr:hypothetical protein [Flavobacterium sp. N502540]
MAIQALNTIKNWFKTGLKPTQTQFWDTWDSFRHKYEKVPVKDVEGIDELLSAKADKSVLNDHLADKNAHAPQGLKSVLDTNPIAAYPTDSHGYSNATIMGNYGNYKYNNITVGSEFDSTSLFQLTNQISLGCRVLGTGEEGNISIFRGDISLNKYKNGKSTIIKIADPVSSNVFEFPAKLERFNNNTYTIATTDDFKTINGESIVGEGNISINGGIEEAPINGNQYGRQNGEWKQITEASTPNLQDVLAQGKVAILNGIAMQIEDMDTNNLTTISGSTITMTDPSNNNNFTLYNANGFQTVGKATNSNFSSAKNGFFYFNGASVHNRLVFAEPGESNSTIILPAKSGTIATTDEIGSPVSATQIGIVDNIALQELGGVDKTISGVRIGKGIGAGAENIVLGSALTGSSFTTGDYNTAIGYDSMIANTTGENNSALGEWALRSNTTGNSNTAIGVNALNANTSGNNNTAIGLNALNANATADFNTALGVSALSKNIDGHQNVAIGASSLRNNVSGNNNVAIGTSAMFNTVGNLNSNVYGALCVAVGAGAMYSNTTGNAVALGANTLFNQTTGTYNIGIGDQAGSGITTGSGNTIIAGTGFILRGGGITTGSNNMILAPNSGNTTGITTGNGNVVLGKVTGLLANASNTITISDGVGNIALTKDTTGEIKAPNLTKTLIVSGGAKSLINKEYLELTTSVENATTAALTATNLNTTYPNAMAGFRVVCTAISGGGLIYEKTATRWIQYSVTTVAP